MNPFEMVVLIVAIVMISSVLKARYRRRDSAYDLSDIERPDAETRLLREEIRALKDRIAVLERCITDTDSASRLDREIDRLRDRS